MVSSSSINKSMHVMTTTSYYYEFLAIIDEVTLSITGNKGRFSHIVQIAAPWNSKCEQLILLCYVVLQELM